MGPDPSSQAIITPQKLAHYLRLALNHLGKPQPLHFSGKILSENS